ncbi:MAG: TRAP transporter permease [Calditrichia bacterium]
MRTTLYTYIAVALCLFIIAEVNYPMLTPQGRLAIFGLLGLTLVFLSTPAHPRLKDNSAGTMLDAALISGIIFCFGYIFIQSEAVFSEFWLNGQPLGNRAGSEVAWDFRVGILGLILVLEATRRAIGLTLPLLALTFLLYAYFGQNMPDWLFPHRGYNLERIVSQTFLHSQGVFGIALNVMFTYVFLFVLFGTLLENTGATGYIIGMAGRLFQKSSGGPAKVAVLSSGLMGSLSGSAVANTATTGTFTIPMMRSSGFKPHVAGGIEAAASSGGALVPPIMGAGAYMMLEIVQPPVTYLEIIRAAIIPAILYYAALLLIVHFYSRRIGAESTEDPPKELSTPKTAQGVVFFGSFAVLLLFLLLGYTPFRAVTLGMLTTLVLSFFSKDTRLDLSGIVDAMVRAGRGGVALIAAAACVGIVIGVVSLTGVGARLPSTLLPLAENNLILALLLLMVSTIILGMGLPSAVCYLLMATLIGPVLGDLGIVPLAAHLFIFYFGMMSMVTPPVALAAYTAAAIAGAGIMRTGLAAFRFALVGFALPYAFVMQPELLLLAAPGMEFSWLAALYAVAKALFAIVPLAAGIAGYAFNPLPISHCIALVSAALVFFLVPPGAVKPLFEIAAVVVVLGIGFLNKRQIWDKKAV